METGQNQLCCLKNKFTILKLVKWLAVKVAETCTVLERIVQLFIAFTPFVRDTRSAL